MSIKYLYDKYDIPDGVLNNDEIIKTYELVDDDEIWYLLNFAYDKADEISPTGRRTPEQIDEIEQLKKELEEDMRQRQKEAEEDKAHSDSVQAWADTQRKKREDSVKREKIEKITRLQEALKNPKIKDLLLKVMNRKITPEQAFADIKANTDLKGKIMSLTYPTKYRGTRIGGKSRVFRRKNKKTTSTSRRNARRTQRHRKSSTRRSRRK
jgi:hypothetical protein